MRLKVRSFVVGLGDGVRGISKRNDVSVALNGTFPSDPRRWSTKSMNSS